MQVWTLSSSPIPRLGCLFSFFLESSQNTQKSNFSTYLPFENYHVCGGGCNIMQMRVPVLAAAIVALCCVRETVAFARLFSGDRFSAARALEEDDDCTDKAGAAQCKTWADAGRSHRSDTQNHKTRHSATHPEPTSPVTRGRTPSGTRRWALRAASPARHPDAQGRGARATLRKVQVYTLYRHVGRRAAPTPAT